MKKEILIAAVSLLWNLLFLAGAVNVAFGCWLAYRPLGFVVAGVFAMVLGYGGGFEQVLKGGRRR